VREFLQFLISASLCVAMVLWLGADKIVDAATQIPLWLFLLVIAALTIQFLMVAVRSVVLLRSSGADIQWHDGFRIFVVGVVANSLVMNVIGGALMRLILLRRIGISPIPAVPSLIVEKGLTFFTLLLFFAVTLPFTLFEARDSFLVLLIASIVVGGCAVVVPVAVVLSSRIKDWQRLQQARDSLSASWRSLTTDRRASVHALILTLVSVAFMFAAYIICAKGVSVSIPVGELLLVLPAVTLAASLPISLGGWGVREISMIAALSAYGTPDTQAVAISALVGLVSLLVPVSLNLLVSAVRSTSGRETPKQT